MQADFDLVAVQHIISILNYLNLVQVELRVVGVWSISLQGERTAVGGGGGLVLICLHFKACSFLELLLAVHGLLFVSYLDC